ncbi:MAG TPA: hypothetical protein ENI82_06640, partial [Bacteroidetes bacterium]|nr:hypothetical protein [Bacteroidota bacterium]
MRTKKILLAILLLIVAMIAVYAFGLKSRSNLAQDHGIQQQYDFAAQDTSKVPEAITEKRSTQIEIVNGKKKIKETIIKMKGDSIIEKKVIEREEDAGNPFIQQDTGSFMGGFYFKPLNPEDLDSLSPFGQNFFNFNNGEDSLIQGFNFSFGPNHQFQIKPFGNYDDDILKQFDFDNQIPDMDFSEMHKRIEEMMDRMQHGFYFDPQIPMEKNPGFPQIKPHSKPKSMKDIITEHLLNDGFINDIDQKYKFEINEKYLKINGKKQDKAIYDKYKKIIED